MCKFESPFLPVHVSPWSFLLFRGFSVLRRPQGSLWITCISSEPASSRLMLSKATILYPQAIWRIIENFEQQCREYLYTFLAPLLWMETIGIFQSQSLLLKGSKIDASCVVFKHYSVLELVDEPIFRKSMLWERASNRLWWCPKVQAWQHYRRDLETSLLYDKDLFERMFKRDNITGGTWKPHFFDGAWFDWMFKVGQHYHMDLETSCSLRKLDLTRCSSLRTLPEGLGNLNSMWRSLIWRDVQAWQCYRRDLETSFLWRSLICANVQAWQHYRRDLETSLLWQSLICRIVQAWQRYPRDLETSLHLTELNLMWCSSFDNITRGTWKPQFFDEAWFDGDVQAWQHYPKGLGNLTSLTELDLWGCSSLTTLPEGLGNLTSLTQLNLGEMFKLDNITQETWKPHFYWRRLNLRECSSLTTLPKGLGNLTSLTNAWCWRDAQAWQHYPEGSWKPHFFDGAWYLEMFKLDNVTRGTWKPHFFDGASFVWMFKLDNVTGGTWKPHFFDAAWFVLLFKLDNITGGTWKPHFFDGAWFVLLFKLSQDITGGTWKPHFFDEAWFVLLFKLDNITGGTWKPHFFDKAWFGAIVQTWQHYQRMETILLWHWLICEDVKAWQHYRKDLETSVLS